MPMLPEEKARVKIDKQLRNAGWDIVARNEYLPNSTSAVKEPMIFLQKMHGILEMHLLGPIITI